VIKDPELVTEYLLSLEKYKAYSAIANGPNSKLYFMPNELQKQPFMPILDNANAVVPVPTK
jgi:regulator of protease activity HflC (stomatin/prohibitin superfamily)